MADVVTAMVDQATVGVSLFCSPHHCPPRPHVHAGTFQGASEPERQEHRELDGGGG